MYSALSRSQLFYFLSPALRAGVKKFPKCIFSIAILHVTRLARISFSSGLVNVDYADDLAALDNTKEGLQETTDVIVKYSPYSAL